MEDRKIYEDIALRTEGDIYIGVVGPVRTGKSTFIKRFMDTLVIPHIENEFKRERATDELPQSAAHSAHFLEWKLSAIKQNTQNSKFLYRCSWQFILPCSDIFLWRDGAFQMPALQDKAF